MTSEPTQPTPPTPPAFVPTATVPKTEVSKSLFDKINAALPIALTALATAFAGMSNGQLQEAMFWRSYAAQDQAKATNQWTLSGFKRDRSLLCQTAAVQLRALQPVPNPFSTNPPAAANATAVSWLAGQGPPVPSLPAVTNADVQTLLDAIQTRRPEAELLQLGKKVRLATINTLLDETEQALDQIDKEWDGPLKAAALLAAQAPKESATAAQAAGFELEQRRYRLEATLNQTLGFRYEARVKISSAQSDRYQRRSMIFFYAMLAAQIGATISSLALARKQQSLLWAIAGLTGLVALSIGGYVYLLE
jgi:hypothetical protein